MKYVVSSLLCLSFGLGEAAAQQTVPPLKKEFLDSAWHVLPLAAGAKYRRETEWRDSTAGEVRDYYLSNGRLQSRGYFDDIRREIIHGAYDTWFATGQLESHTNSQHGKLEGEQLQYYPDGKLQRREVFAGGQRTGGECLDPNGQPMDCPVVVEVMPVYAEGDGGSQAIITAVQRNFRYPRKALRAKAKGRLVVAFVVDEQGQVVDIHMAQPLHPLLDTAAMQAVQKLKPFRQPGTQNGKPVRVAYNVPITLDIQ
jgi:protein TonB